MNDGIVKMIDRVPGDRVPLASREAEELAPETFWKEFVCRHQPLVIRGAAREWPALKHWQDTRYLCDLAARDGQYTSVVYYTFNHNVGLPAVDRPALLPVRESVPAIVRAGADETHYVALVDLPQEWEGELGSYSCLDSDHDLWPRLYPRRRLYAYRNSGADWHMHAIDETLTTQIRERKRISLFCLNAKNWDFYSTAIEYNLHHVGEGRCFFPSEGLTKFEAILEPGDTVYIPPFYWHALEPLNHEVGITFAHCFCSPLTRIGDLRNPLKRCVLRRARRGRGLHTVPWFMGLLALSRLARWRAGEAWDVPTSRG